jgi:hypothetical protein
MKFPFFKSKPKEDIYTLSHPDLHGKTEVAFEAGGKKFYRFIDQHAMPTGRYKYVYAALREVDLRMDLATMKAYIADLKASLNGEKKQVDLGAAWKTILNIETRLSLAFEPEGVKKLASVCYFTEDEILTTWSKKEGQEKVDFWNKHNCMDFFLTRPIGELTGLSDYSITSLETYLREVAYPILEELNLQMPTSSSENF